MTGLNIHDEPYIQESILLDFLEEAMIQLS